MCALTLTPSHPKCRNPKTLLRHMFIDVACSHLAVTAGKQKVVKDLVCLYETAYLKDCINNMGNSFTLISRKDKRNKHGQDFVSASICKIARTISQRIPLKVWIVAIYHKFYNEIIHKGIIRRVTNLVEYEDDWATVVGSYVEETCTNDSDIDLMRGIGTVFMDPDDIPRNLHTGLIVITERSRVPAGSCWLRIYNTTKFDRYSESSKKRNGLEWFLDNEGVAEQINIVCRHKRVDGHTHLSYKSVFEKPVCWRPAIVENKDGYRYLSRKMVEDYFSMSGLTVWDSFNKLLPDWLGHGPAFKQTYFGCLNVDVVNAFHCSKGWPDTAREWETRQRKWPDADLVSEIIRSGFHIVPIASKVEGFEDPDLEWRLSFREAETKLVQSFNESQKLCYVTLKILLKEYIQPKFPDEDFMSSYIMKTLMFWILEESDANIWEFKNMVICLSLCLEKLKNWLERCFCPNYFIPDYNLFRTKQQRMFVVGFREWLVPEIDRYGWKLLIKCNSFKCLTKTID